MNWDERLVKGKIAITETVTNNKLPLPKDLGDKKNAVIKDPTLNAKMISHLQSAYKYSPISNCRGGGQLPIF